MPQAHTYERPCELLIQALLVVWCFVSSPLSFPSQTDFSWEFSEGKRAKQTLALLLLLLLGSHSVKHILRRRVTLKMFQTPISSVYV